MRTLARAHQPRQLACLLLLSALVVSAVVGCSSAAPQSATMANGAAGQGSQAAPAEPAAPAAAPIEIRSLDLREEAPGVALVVGADRPLVWTSYRDAEGRLVLELPNSAPAAGVVDLAPQLGLVTMVDVEAEAGLERPLTRLTVQTRGDAEHSLAAEGNNLYLRLLPAGGEEPAAVAAEPLPEEGSVDTMVEAAPTAGTTAPPMGTPDAPAAGPPPSGVRATALRDVVVRGADGGAVIEVRGDGEFAYSTFELDEPPRFVVDLQGVTNTSAAAIVPVGGTMVDRVRVAQFKPSPDPIARVVFDLRQATVPVLERSTDGLVVRFGAAAATATLAESLATTEPMTATAPPAVTYEPAPEAAPPAPEPSAAEPPPVDTPAAAVVPPPPMPQMAPLPRPTAAPVEAIEAAEVPPEPGDEQREAVLQSFRERSVAGGEKVYVGEPMTISLKDADIKDVLRTFAKISGLNVVVQPGVRGSVTVELENVPWDQALDQILKINNLGMELEGNILRIAPRGILQREAEEAQKLKAAQALSVPLQTVLKRLSYARAQDMRRITASVMSARGSIIIDPRTNTLIIKELPAYMETVIAVIENLDVPEPQVMIEARIVETTKRFSRTLGIAWGFDGVADARHGNTTGLVFPNNIEGSGGVSLLTGGRNAFLNLAMGNILNTFTLEAQLAAAESEGLINVLSAPKVATLNNEQATIQSGLQIPIQTIANNTVSVQFVNATLRLSVTPQVTAAGTVLMDIAVQKRNPELAFAVVGATNAPINTREAKTRVIVRDGGTTVIGGIYEVTSDFGEDRVPGLANVPIIGHLFKNRRKNDENKELLIFITPRVVKL